MHSQPAAISISRLPSLLFAKKTHARLTLLDKDRCCRVPVPECMRLFRERTPVPSIFALHLAFIPGRENAGIV